MPLEAHTANEARYYLMVARCQSCGKGPWVFDNARQTQPKTKNFTVHAHCKNCGNKQNFKFAYSHDIPAAGKDAETINPTKSPSRIIDLNQWLSLFYLMLESASSEKDPAVSRSTSYCAAMCLGEALKFYKGDDELPPESAFFFPETQRVFHQQPEKFARQKLRDIQAKLPKVGVMARRIARDDRVKKRRWWQFWTR